MIQNTQEGEVVLSNGVESKMVMGISREGFDDIYMMDAVSTTLYENAIQAIIRELSTNAMDANIDAGKEDLPIQVTLPTNMDLTFRVRDFGFGLSDTQMGSVFNYGRSTKREDVKSNGFLGLGAKSPFSYVDSFNIISIQNGIKSSYVYYKDSETRERIMSKLFSQSTNEPSGLEIQVAVQPYDVKTFENNASRVYRYFSVPPIVKNVGSSFSMEKDAAKMVIENSRIIGGNSKFGNLTSMAVMSNVAYPIDANQFSDNSFYYSILSSGIEIEFPNGTVKFTSSREKLHYTPETKKAISQVLDNVTKKITEEVQKKFLGFKTLWEAKIGYSEIFSEMGTLGQRLSNNLRDKIEWNGIVVKGSNFVLEPIDGVLVKEASWGRKVECSLAETGTIQASKETIVLINDLKDTIKPYISRRLQTVKEKRDYNHIYLIHFFDDAAKAEWMKENNFETCPIQNISEFEPAPLNATLYAKNKKHSTKVFKWVGASVHPSSAAWEIAEVDLDNDEGVYVVIDRFNVDGNTQPDEFRKKVRALTEQGVNVPEIYGVKASQLDKKPIGKGFIELKVWAKAELQKNVAGFIQTIANNNEINKITSMSKYDRITEKMDELNDGLLKSFMEDYIQMKVENVDVAKANTFMNTYRIFSADVIDAKPLHEISSQIEKISSRYPLLRHINDRNSYYTPNFSADEIIEYVNLID